MDLNTKLDTPEARAAYAAEIRKQLGTVAEEKGPAGAVEIESIKPGMSPSDAQRAAAAIRAALREE